MKILKLLLIVLFSFSSFATDASTKENIVFIIVDDLRELTMAKNQLQMITPNIDKLKHHGVTFQNAFTNNPVCGASRASMLTGIRPKKGRFTSFTTQIDKDMPKAVTIASYLKENGYTTISNGKISHFFKDASYGWSELYRPKRNSPKDYLDPKNYNNLVYNDKNIGFGSASEFVYTEDNGYIDGKVAEKTIKDIQKLKNSNNPFFIAVGFIKPHLPFLAPKKYFDMYDGKEIVLPTNNFFPKSAPKEANYFYELRNFYDIPNKGPISDEKAKELIRAYYACVSYIDAQIGKIMDELATQDLLKNTTIILTSDHGFSLSEHGRWTKHNLFQYELKIPMVISSSKFKKGQVTESFAELVDIFPTICDLTGLEIPSFTQGNSLVKSLVVF